MEKTIKRILEINPPANICVRGWIKTCRKTPNLFFIELNDGSTTRNLQVVADTKQFSSAENFLNLGQAVEIHGELVKSPAPKQPVEVRASKIIPLGDHDPENYPIQKKEITLEFLREIAHLRPRTNTLGSAFRVRSVVSFAIHEFFQSRDFYYVHTPIITSSDCEGAGEMFRVTTLNPGEKDHSKDFFGKETFLTVSGQLEGEALALALGRIYTFGPTFRAENSNTTRHLAEFWMIEPEMAFFDLDATIDLAEDLLKYCVKTVLEKCEPELNWLSSFNETDLVKQLTDFVAQRIHRITYKEAVDILSSAQHRFEYKPGYGKDIQTEHERFLVDEYFRGAVAVSQYPKELKPFYAYQNDDGTVNNFDLLMPRIGETIGGSQREHRLNRLIDRMKELNLDEHTYQWYVDLRRFSSAPHSGFGLGLERLMIYVTGLRNVRDTIPFPRYPGHAEF